MTERKPYQRILRYDRPNPDPEAPPLFRFIFVASPGYSGTATLAGILDKADGVECFHERHPSMVAHLRSSVLQGRDATVAEFYEKVVNILSDLSRPPFITAARGEYEKDVFHINISTGLRPWRVDVGMDPLSPFSEASRTEENPLSDPEIVQIQVTPGPTEQWRVKRTQERERTNANGYCDTNHMFVKNWGPAVLSEFVDGDVGRGYYEVSILFVRRYLPDTLRSVMAVKKNMFQHHRLSTHANGPYPPTFSTLANHWSPFAPEDLDKMDAAVGYLLDTFVKADLMRKREPTASRVRWLDMWMDDMNSPGPLQALLDGLRVGRTPAFTRFYDLVRLGEDRAVDAGTAFKPKKGNPHTSASIRALPKDYFRYRIFRYIEALQNQFRGVNHWSLPIQLMSYQNATECRVKAAAETGYISDKEADEWLQTDLRIRRGVPLGVPMPAVHPVKGYTPEECDHMPWIHAANVAFPRLRQKGNNFSPAPSPSANAPSFDFPPQRLTDAAVMDSDPKLQPPTAVDAYSVYSCRVTQCLRSELEDLMEGMPARVARMESEQACRRFPQPKLMGAPPALAHLVSDMNAALANENKGWLLDTDDLEAKKPTPWENVTREAEDKAIKASHNAMEQLCAIVQRRDKESAGTGEMWTTTERAEIARLVAAAAGLVVPPTKAPGGEEVVGVDVTDEEALGLAGHCARVHRRLCLRTFVGRPAALQ